MSPFVPNVYAQEAWYPMFILTFLTNALVLWAGIMTDALRRGYSPSTGAQFFAGLGALMMVHPAGLAVWGSFNMTFLSSGLPTGVLVVCSTYAVLLPVFFWTTLFAPFHEFLRKG
ncbi:MAG: hypothetical protein WC657_03140 [Candidatus Paceibacterota bacterium]|jgi:hypothetical protein